MEKKEVMVMNLTPRVEEMEGARGATGISSTAALRGSGIKTAVPNPEVPEKASRRSYTAEYKRRILREVEGCKEYGQVQGRSVFFQSDRLASSSRARHLRCPFIQEERPQSPGA